MQQYQNQQRSQQQNVNVLRGTPNQGVVYPNLVSHDSTAVNQRYTKEYYQRVMQQGGQGTLQMSQQQVSSNQFQAKKMAFNQAQYLQTQSQTMQRMGISSLSQLQQAQLLQMQAKQKVSNGMAPQLNQGMVYAPSLVRMMASEPPKSAPKFSPLPDTIFPFESSRQRRERELGMPNLYADSLLKETKSFAERPKVREVIG